MDTSRRSKEKHPSIQMPNTPGDSGGVVVTGDEQQKGQVNNKQCVSYDSHDVPIQQSQ